MKPNIRLQLNETTSVTGSKLVTPKKVNRGPRNTVTPKRTPNTTIKTKTRRGMKDRDVL